MNILCYFLDKIWPIGLTFLVTNFSQVILFSQSLIRWNKDVRFSIAYLYQINIDNKYLLIQGNKISGQYQPIGGVFKAFESFSEIKSKFEIVNEDKTGFYEEGDLRFETKGKNVQKVVNWFNSKRNREVNVIREFYEELIETNLIKPICLNKINFEFIKQIKPIIKFSEQFQKDEIKIFEIYKVYLPDDVKNEIKQLIAQNNNVLKLVTKDEIHKKCFFYDDKSHKISDHSINIL